MELNGSNLLKEGGHASPPPILVSDHLKSEYIEDDFPLDICSSKSVFQDLHHLDHNFSLTASSSLSHHHDRYGIQLGSNYDPFDPFSYGSNPSDHDMDLYEFKPFELENNNGGMIMQSFHGGGGYLTNSNLMVNKTVAMMAGENELGYDHMLHLDESPAQGVKPMNFFVPPDETSCVTADLNGYNKQGGGGGGGLKRNSTRKPCNKPKKKTNSSKGQWTKEEDRILIHLVEKFGVRKWSYIAQMLKGRIGKQCRERWHNHLRPDIKKDFWTEEEDRILIDAHAEVGNKWSEIAKRLPGRTENSIKNHWNATKRRQYTRRKCRSKWPRPSPILQNYIKSLNLQNGPGPKSKAKASPTPDPDHGHGHGHNDQQPETNTTNDFCLSDDRLVPDYDFNEMMTEFALDDKLLQLGDSIESLLDEDLDDDNKGCFDMEISSSYDHHHHMPGVLLMEQQNEVKKELDLMEMISQVNL